MTRSPQVSDADEIIVLCARLQLRPAQRERLRKLLLRVDWMALSNVAGAHGMLPLLYHHLSELETDEMPAPQMQSLRTAFELNVRRNFYFASALLQIMAKFNAGGIGAIPWKGPILAASVYGDLALREFWDLDFLLAQRDIPKAQELLGAIGYRGLFRSDLPGRYMGEYPFTSARGEVRLELHTELTLRHFPHPVDFGALLRRAGTVSISGAAIPCLSVEDNLIFLCMHGAKDFWARLSWVCDVSELLSRFPGMDWNEVERRSTELGVARMVRVGLLLASDLLEAEMRQDIRRKAETDRTAVRLAGAMARRMFLTVPSAHGLTEQFLFRVQTADNLAEGLRYAARLALAPTEEDVLFHELPKSLSFAYPLLRPIRFLRNRRARRSQKDAPNADPENASTDAR